MKFFLTLILVFFSISCFAETTLQDVLDLYAHAYGGKKALENVQSIEISLTIQEPKFTVDAIYRADRKIRMRIDILADNKRVYTEAYDGKQGWDMGEDGKIKDESVDGAAALRNGVLYPGKVFGLHELQKMGDKLSYEGREEVDGISYHVIKLILDSGAEKYFYINPDNGRIERSRDLRPLHVDLDPSKKLIESQLSDFRMVDGVLFAFKSVQVDLKTKEVLQTTTIKSIKLNPEIDESIFSKPDAKQSLFFQPFVNTDHGPNERQQKQAEHKNLEPA